MQVTGLAAIAGYKAAIDDRLKDALSIPDGFFGVKLGTPVVDKVVHRVRQDLLENRGRQGARALLHLNILRAWQWTLTEKQRIHLARAFDTEPAQ